MSLGIMYIAEIVSHSLDHNNFLCQKDLLRNITIVQVKNNYKKSVKFFIRLMKKNDKNISQLKGLMSTYWE